MRHLFTATCLLLLACETETEETSTPATEQAAKVNWDLEGLEPLGDGYVYEGWVIVAGEPVSTGRFNAEGMVPTTGSYELTAEQAEGAEAFVLTIEPDDSMMDDPAPSATKLVGGDFDTDGMATVDTTHPATLGHDFSGAAGSFILETPTSAATDDYSQGVWFLDMSAGPGPSLTLPALPEGWAYEGWVVDGDGPVSTGRFTALDMADDDGAGPDAGPEGAPPFPGQDFIDPAMDLVGSTVVISIEPEPDDSPAPFSLKPLIAMDIADVGAGTPITLTNQAASTAVSGTAWIE